MYKQDEFGCSRFIAVEGAEEDSKDECESERSALHSQIMLSSPVTSPFKCSVGVTRDSNFHAVANNGNFLGR